MRLIMRVLNIFVILQLLSIECLQSYFPFSELQISTWHQVTRTITLTLRKTNCMKVHSKCNKYISSLHVSRNSVSNIFRNITIIYQLYVGPEEDPDDCGLPILCIFYVVIVLILCVTIYTTIKGSKD